MKSTDGVGTRTQIPKLSRIAEVGVVREHATDRNELGLISISTFCRTHRVHDRVHAKQAGGECYSALPEGQTPTGRRPLRYVEEEQTPPAAMRAPEKLG